MLFSAHFNNFSWSNSFKNGSFSTKQSYSSGAFLFHDISHFSFCCRGAVSIRGRSFLFQLPPPAFPNNFHPAARRLTPPSSGNVYVINRLYPNALTARQAARQSLEGALRAPSVQQRVNSAVQPSSISRAIGRPTTAIPRILSPSATPIQTMHPLTGL